MSMSSPAALTRRGGAPLYQPEEERLETGGRGEEVELVIVLEDGAMMRG